MKNLLPRTTKKLTKKNIWKALNTPTWTPLGLCGWVAFIVAPEVRSIILRIILSAIIVFTWTCWYVRESKKLKIKDKNK